MKGVTPKDLALDIDSSHPGALKYHKEIGAFNP
jgi:hypothetical protein